jgi:hypothetical protein
MLKFIGALCLGLAAQGALAQDSAVANETPAADQASDKAESKALAAATGEEKEFKAPLGFQTKKRGELTLYCKKETTVGTRFKTEKCYSEDQVRDYILTQQENKRNIDRIRSTCGSGSEACVHQ